MGLVIKLENDWRSVGWPQVAMLRNCHLFLVCAIFKTDSINYVMFVDHRIR